jgi:Ca2+-binding EF-hand superfamily protein
MAMKLAVVALLVGLTGVASADAQQRPRPLKQLLLQKFDRNHDGKLGPRERKHAAKALHKLAKRLEKAPDGARVQKREKFIRRFDINGDGNVGPGEMPPALADELRPLDRDGDGWLQNDELP